MLAAILSVQGSAQGHERYQQVLVDLASSEEIANLPSFDEHSFGNRTGGIEAILSESDVAALQDKGFRVTILISDLQRFYADRAAASLEKKNNLAEALSTDGTPANFTLGSVAGYYTPQELLEELNRMRQLYPSLISEPISIGKSVEGRDIFAVRISAASDEGMVPEILYTGMHHAREPISMMSLIYTMWSLLEGYDGRSDIGSLLRSRALWFVPLVNPDGYAYNIQFFPEGGGLWRKNRGGIDSEGTDLNRNYGLTPTWQTPPDDGVDDPLSGSYRGPSPFSEPETRAMRDFVRSHDFRLALNFHSYSNVLIYKHEGTIPELGDTAWYLHSARELALENGFGHGRGAEAIGYDASGTFDEWLFKKGSEERHIFAWTPEVGSTEDGFWPAPDRIPDICRQMLPLSLRGGWMAGAYPQIVGWESNNAEEGIRLTLTVANIGADAMQGTGSIALNGYDATTTPIPSLRPGASGEITISLPKEITDRLESRTQLEMVVRYGSHEWTREIDALIHPIDSLFADGFEGSLNRWSNDLWDIETSGQPRGRVVSDSPYEDYFESDIPNILELTEPVSLAGYDAAELRFEAKGMIRGIHHYLAIEGRRSSERTWHPLDGEYLQRAVENRDETRNRLRGANREWRQYIVPLDEFAGEDVVIRFVMNTPFSGGSGPLYDGALIDNVSLVGARDLPSSVVADDPEANEHGLLAWPNPCRDLLHVQPTTNQPASVQLFDLLGREVISSSTATVLSLDMTPLPEGTYILNVRNEEGVVRRKIVKR